MAAPAAGPQTGSADTAQAIRKSVNLNDPYSIKRALDDATTEVILARGYSENNTLSNWKMVIGLITCGIAIAAQLYPKKFPDNKPFLIFCIILYLIFNVLLQVIIVTKEKNHILFTNPLPGTFSSTGLAVSTRYPRYSESYTIRIASADPQSIAAHAPIEFTKSVTKWFTKDGVLAEGLFQDDVLRILDEFESEPKKSL